MRVGLPYLPVMVANASSVAGGATIEEHRTRCKPSSSVSAGRARHARTRAGLDDGGLDVGGEDVDAGRPADQARHLVGGHAEHEHGSASRTGSPAASSGSVILVEDLPIAAARHHTGLLVLPPHRARCSAGPKPTR